MAGVFHTGQRVVCIADSWKPRLPGIFVYPELGCIYTVRGVVLGDGEFAEHSFLWLVEIRNPSWSREEGEPAWVSCAFRPLVEDRIEQLRAHLAPAPRQLELVP